MAIAAKTLSPLVGSQIDIDLETLLEGSLREEIRALLVERGVLIARDLEMTDAQQRAFTATLGELRLGTVSQEGDAGLMKVTLDKERNPEYADFFPGTMFWHMDGTYDATPPFATVLRPIVIAPEGGQTEFANTYAAYEALPEDYRAWLDTLQVVHSMQAAMFHACPEADLEQIARWCSYPTRTQPLVWQHKSGRKSLALSTSCSHIVGLHPAESHALLQELLRHATQPQFVYSHQWQPNDLLMWDNTGTMHRGRPYDPASGRLMHRFTLNGEEPMRAVA
ncbi:TauD/TfdA dioxygenase family protein [Haliea sp. E17]|uniref:TauD/TfdA dioxygenase family protein n=1 Tax=Haliea sp. E17 TaxID=3401576 RepID=UPI003AB0D69B